MTLAEQIEIACLMEATARKPGNVHPAAAFSDLCYDDFARAAAAIAEPLAAASEVGLGRAILDAVRATKAAIGTNVNLGIVFLLAPLAAVPTDVPLELGLPQILNSTTIEDAELVYAAIRLAQPGGMGEVSSQDIHEQPTVTLREAMALAADRDRIAEQYVGNFWQVFTDRRLLCELFAHQNHWEDSIVLLQIWMMSHGADTLIARKCGQDIAEKARARAAKVLESAFHHGVLDPQQLAEFDAWLRADGHRRNPGTTADLIAAVLFAGVRDGLIEAPSRDEVRRLAAAIRNDPYIKHRHRYKRGITMRYWNQYDR